MFCLDEELSISPPSNLEKCRLYSCVQLNGMLQNSNDLCFLHCNTRCMVKNLPKLTVMLGLFPKLPDVFCVSETKV